jgi:hypothetical protein
VTRATNRRRGWLLVTLGLVLGAAASRAAGGWLSWSLGALGLLLVLLGASVLVALARYVREPFAGSEADYATRPDDWRDLR